MTLDKLHDRIKSVHILWLLSRQYDLCVSGSVHVIFGCVSGSGRVTFSSFKSYVKAVQAAFVEVKTTKFTKKVRVIHSALFRILTTFTRC